MTMEGPHLTGEISSQDQEGMVLEPGALVDHFKILRLLGRGGMGEVYLARDTKLGRKVALKCVTLAALGSQEVLDRFVFEARITAQFNHPHIVTIHAVGETPFGPYVALEYLEGQTLRERLAERPGLRDGLRYGLAIAEALQEAHRHQVLHRDLKPENVVIPRDGRLRVLDFGLAKIVGAQEPGVPRGEGIRPTILDLFRDYEAQFKSNADEILGTPYYMAPEQWAGRPCTDATDIWALGMILHELLKGKHPFSGAKIHQICMDVCGPDPMPSARDIDGVPPELADLVDRCLSKEGSLRPGAVEVVGLLREMLFSQARIEEWESPFRGLLPFTEQNRDFFFGREGEVGAFLERLRQEPVLPVVGPSGAGKTSFVQAGVIPRLREQGSWHVLTMRPGSQPFRSLASRLLSRENSTRLPAKPSPLDTHNLPEAATRGGGVSQLEETRLAKELAESPGRLALMLGARAEQLRSRVLLFVDQMEELYTLVGDREVRRSFMEALCHAADDAFGPVRVVFTLRDDYLGRMAESAEAREALSRVAVLRCPGPEALREILVKPLEPVGYGYDDPALVDEIVEAVQGEAAALPLIQFACQVLWEGRDSKRRLLRRRVYEDRGGVAGALAYHADSVLEGLSAHQVQLARAMLLRLVTGERTRRVISWPELVEGLGPEAEEVLERLTAARLVLVRKSRIRGQAEAELELVHESLIRRWDRLARWIDESREELAFLEEMGQAAELWEKRGLRYAEVWQGEALQEARRYLAPGAAPVSELVRRFIEAGERRERRVLRKRRLLWASGLALVALVIVVSWVVVLVVAEQKEEARWQKERAEAAQAQAEAGRGQARHRTAEALREGARAALVSGAYLEARSKLRGSLEVEDSPLARALWRRLSQDPLVWSKSVGTAIYSVAYSPDGRRVAAGCLDRSVYLFDTQTQAMTVLRGHPDQVHSVAFSPDGVHLAAGTWEGQVWLWNLKRGRGKIIRGHTSTVRDVAISPDSKVLATASWDKTVKLWSIATGVRLKTLIGPQGLASTVAFSPDGRTVAAGGDDRQIFLWDVATGAPRKVLTGHTAVIWRVAFSPDGKLLASAGDDQAIRIWDMESGGVKRILSGHTAGVRGLSFTPDGKHLASGADDQTIRIWDLATGKTRLVLQGARAIINSLAFSPDGSRLVSGGFDQHIHLWDITGRPAPPIPSGHRSPVTTLELSPDEKWMATGGDDSYMLLWDLARGKAKRVLRGHRGGVRCLAFSPDGRTLASGSDDQSVMLWDPALATQRKVLYGHVGRVYGLAFAPNGKALASSGMDQTIRLWDSESGITRKILRGHSSRVAGVSFSPDGRLLASGGLDQTIRLWDPVTGELKRTLLGHTGRVWGVSFSPNGRLLASGSDDQTLRVWTMPTGQSRIVGKHKGRVYWVGFHPDSQRVGAPCSDGKALIWNLGTNKAVTLRGHRSEVNKISFHPQGKLVATASDDSTVRLWEADTGRPAWRAPLLLPHPPRLLTHRGWIALDPLGPKEKLKRSQWRRAVETRSSTAAVSEDGPHLCLATSQNELELWDRGSDKLLFSKPLPGLDRLLALPQGCLALARGQVLLFTPRGASQVIQDKATAMAWQKGHILVAHKRKILAYDLQGKLQRSHPADRGVTAMLLTDDWLILGYSEGNIELVPLAAGPKPSFPFEDVPSSPVERLLPGPMGTLIVGYANGLLGIWSLSNGAQLDHVRLHGPVVHLLAREGKLYGATELGDTQVLDLGVFHRDYCDLLREVWSRVGTTWEGGLPKLAKTPQNHLCSPGGSLQGK